MEAWAFIICAFAVVGVILIIYGLVKVNEDTRWELYAAGGIALLSTLLVSYVILEAESSISDTKEEAEWKERMQYQDKLPGFNPGSHPGWKEINYSAKEMPNAQLQNRDARGIQMRGSILSGANFSNTRLQGAILEGSSFDDAKFEGADLSGADLRDTHLENSNIQEAKSLKGAKVNVGTCWPRGFEQQHPNVMRYLVVMGKKDIVLDGEVEKVVIIKENGREPDNCLLGRGGK